MPLKQYQIAEQKRIVSALHFIESRRLEDVFQKPHRSTVCGPSQQIMIVLQHHVLQLRINNGFIVTKKRTPTFAPYRIKAHDRALIFSQRQLCTGGYSSGFARVTCPDLYRSGSFPQNSGVLLLIEQSCNFVQL